MKRIAIILGALVLLTGCEGIFTYVPPLSVDVIVKPLPQTLMMPPPETRPSPQGAKQ